MERKQSNVHFTSVKQPENIISEVKKCSSEFINTLLKKSTEYSGSDLCGTNYKYKDNLRRYLSIDKLNHNQVRHNEFKIRKSYSEDNDLDRLKKKDTSYRCVKKQKVEEPEKNNSDNLKLYRLLMKNSESDHISVKNRAQTDAEIYYDSISVNGLKSESSGFESAMSSNDIMTPFSTSHNSGMVIAIVTPVATKIGINYASLTSENIPSKLNEISEHRYIKANGKDDINQPSKKSLEITLPQYPENCKNLSIKKLIGLTKMRDTTSQTAPKKISIRRHFPYVIKRGKQNTPKIILNGRNKGINLKELYLSQRGKVASCMSFNRDKSDFPVDYGNDESQLKTTSRQVPYLSEITKERDQQTIIRKKNDQRCSNEKYKFGKDSNAIDLRMKHFDSSHNRTTTSLLNLKGVGRASSTSNQLPSTDRSKR